MYPDSVTVSDGSWVRQRKPLYQAYKFDNDPEDFVYVFDLNKLYKALSTDFV